MFCAEARPVSPCDCRCATIISAVISRGLWSGSRWLAGGDTWGGSVWDGGWSGGCGGGCRGGCGGSCVSAGGTCVSGGCGPAVHDCSASGSLTSPLSGASVGEPGCSKQGCPKFWGRPCFSH